MAETKSSLWKVGAVCLIGLLFAVPALGTPDYDPSADLAGIGKLLAKLRALPPVSGNHSKGPEVRPRVAIYGDSTASILTVGIASWLDRMGVGHPRLGVAQLGCGLLEDGDYRFRGTVLNRPKHCRDRSTFWEDNVRAQRPDIAIVSFGPWEVCDRRWASGTEWTRIGTPEFDQKLRQKLNAATNILARGGARVIWVTQPGLLVRDPITGELPNKPFPESAPERMQRYNQLVREMAASRPETVQVLELAEYLRKQPGGEFSSELRPDGIHLDAAAALRLTNKFIGPEIMRLAAMPLPELSRSHKSP